MNVFSMCMRLLLSPAAAGVAHEEAQRCRVGSCGVWWSGGWWPVAVCLIPPRLIRAACHRPHHTTDRQTKLVTYPLCHSIIASLYAQG